ncbi:MAG: hypothetical protein R2856_19225 [Caldilineaceae bacterium]
MSYAIEIEGLRKVYSKRGRADVVAVEDLNLNVSADRSLRFPRRQQGGQDDHDQNGMWPGVSGIGPCAP